MLKDRCSQAGKHPTGAQSKEASGMLGSGACPRSLADWDNMSELYPRSGPPYQPPRNPTASTPAS